MSACIELINWNLLFDGRSVDDAWEVFKRQCKVLFKDFVPTRRAQTKSASSSKRRYPKEIVRLLNKKRLLFRKFGRTGGALYKSVCRKCKTALAKWNLKVESDILRCRNNKRFFSFINRTLRSKPCIPDLKFDGKVFSDDSSKCDVFNKQYTSVFVRDDNRLISLPDVNVVDPLTFLCITRCHVLRAIKRLKASSAAGPDGLPAMFFKRCAPQLSVPLQTLFSRSLREGRLPAEWKLSKIIPVFKKGSRSDPGNYRPVALTCIACKLMERILKDVLTAHLESNGLITRHQHGFRFGRSTQTALLESLNDWTRSVDRGHSVDVVYFDVSKAFDTVVHSKLLSKLTSYGVTGPIYHWIADFLSDRKQFVSLNSASSVFSSVVSGVPQGSVLGPLLFLIFINDIVNCVKYSKISMFADDTKLSGEVDTKEQYDKLLCDVRSIFKWMELNQLDIAAAKCVVLHLGNKNPCNEYVCGNFKLSVVEVVKDLGLNLSTDLKPSRHCSVVSAKAFRKMSLLLKGFSCRDPLFLKAAFCIYVRPILGYASSCWNPTLLKDVRLVESVQRRFTKRIPGLQGLTYVQRLDKLNLESLELRRLKADLCQAFKILKGHDRLDKQDFFVSAAGITRGHEYKVRVPLYSSQLFRSTFSYRVAKVWNSLKPEAVNVANLAGFRRQLDRADLRNFLVGLV